MRNVLSAVILIALFNGCKKDDDNTPEESTPVQVPLQLVVDFVRNSQAYDLTSYISDANGRSVEFNKVRVLLSNFRLLDANGSVTHTFAGKVVLLDRANGQQQFLELGTVSTGLLQRLAFDIGLDATTNQMDPTQFSGPPLTDQTLWINSTSGHKFFTLEGRVDSDNDGIVEGSEQAVTYQCITSAMVRTDEVNTNSAVAGSPAQVHVALDLGNILNGINCVATPTAVGASSLNAQLMSNLQSGLHLY